MPAFADNPFRLVTSIPSAWIEAELPFDAAPRYLLSMFVIDRPLLLQAVLTAVDSGITVPAEGMFAQMSEPDRTIRFSIDGSLASSMRGAFMTAMVIRAAVPEELLRFRSDLDHQVQTLLQMQVAAQLDELDLPENTIRNIEVQVFQGIGGNLFRDRRFTEYRFGVRTGSENAQQRVASMILEFSRHLGEYSSPIAYVYFPDMDHLTSKPDNVDWVRLGVGAPARAVESMEIDLIANSLARSYQCIYRKYDPVLPGGSMESRFMLIADYDKYLSVDPAPGEDSGATAVDVVFAQGRARAGLVGQMLAGNVGPRVLAGSMTVLAGHTISSWVVPAGVGAELIDDIRSLEVLEDTSTSLRLYNLGPLNESPRTEVGSDSCWVAWRCCDKPGVARLVVDTIISEMHHRGVDPDFRYMISRVLANGESCAGKLKFRTPRFEETPIPLRAIREGLKSALTQGGRDCDVELRVQSAEPAEEPWASLLVI